MTPTPSDMGALTSSAASRCASEPSDERRQLRRHRALSELLLFIILEVEP